MPNGQIWLVSGDGILEQSANHRMCVGRQAGPRPVRHAAPTASDWCLWQVAMPSTALIVHNASGIWWQSKDSPWHGRLPKAPVACHGRCMPHRSWPCLVAHAHLVTGAVLQHFPLPHQLPIAIWHWAVARKAGAERLLQDAMTTQQML